MGRRVGDRKPHAADALRWTRSRPKAYGTCLNRTRRGGAVSSPDKTAQGAQGTIGDLIHRAGGIDAEQDALVGVERDKRRGLLLIHHKPVPDRLLAVIVTLEQLAAAVVADARPGRWVERRVPYPPAPPAGAPARQAAHHLVVVHDQLQHHVQPRVP